MFFELYAYLCGEEQKYLDKHGSHLQNVRTPDPESTSSIRIDKQRGIRIRSNYGMSIVTINYTYFRVEGEYGTYALPYDVI